VFYPLSVLIARKGKVLLDKAALIRAGRDLLTRFCASSPEKGAMAFQRQPEQHSCQRRQPCSDFPFQFRFLPPSRHRFDEENPSPSPQGRNEEGLYDFPA